MNQITTHLRSVLALATALIVAAIVAAPGFAGRADDRAGVRGAGTPVSTANVPDFVDRYVAAHAARPATVRPDDRPGMRGEFPATAPAPEPTRTGDGFQWDDAGIGAGMLAALLLAGGSGLALLRRTTRRSAPEAA